MPRHGTASRGRSRCWRTGKSSRGSLGAVGAIAPPTCTKKPAKAGFFVALPARAIEYSLPSCDPSVRRPCPGHPVRSVPVLEPSLSTRGTLAKALRRTFGHYLASPAETGPHRPARIIFLFKTSNYLARSPGKAAEAHAETANLLQRCARYRTRRVVDFLRGIGGRHEQRAQRRGKTCSGSIGSPLRRTSKCSWVRSVPDEPISAMA